LLLALLRDAAALLRIAVQIRFRHSRCDRVIRPRVLRYVYYLYVFNRSSQSEFRGQRGKVMALYRRCGNLLYASDSVESCGCGAQSR